MILSRFSLDFDFKGFIFGMKLGKEMEKKPKRVMFGLGKR